MKTDFAYQAEKLSQARRALMLPHTKGEAVSIANALQACSLGFRDLNPGDLDDTARLWYKVIAGMMDTTGVQDPAGRGAWTITAEGFNADEKIELSRAIDELAHWFERHFWETHS